MAKKNESAVAVADLHEKIDSLEAECAEIGKENEYLRREVERLMKDCIRFEDRFGEEHQKRMRERGRADKTISELTCDNECLRAKLDAERELRAVSQRKKQASVSKLVIASAVAVVLLTVPCALQKLSIIGPQLSYAIECSLMMVIAWCYALIWDRSKK